MMGISKEVSLLMAPSDGTEQMKGLTMQEILRLRCFASPTFWTSTSRSTKLSPTHVSSSCLSRVDLPALMYTSLALTFTLVTLLSRTSSLHRVPETPTSSTGRPRSRNSDTSISMASTLI